MNIYIHSYDNSSNPDNPNNPSNPSNPDNFGISYIYIYVWMCSDSGQGDDGVPIMSEVSSGVHLYHR